MLEQNRFLRTSGNILLAFMLSIGANAFAKDLPYEVGDDFQSTIEIAHANRQIHIGDFLHVMDVHGQQVGMVRVSRFDSNACIARVVDGVAPKGSILVRDIQMSADRNRRSHVRAIASVDADADKVGAARRDEGVKQESSVDGEVSGWRAWTPIKSMKMRKMVFLGLSPSNVYATGSDATPKFNFGFNLGVNAELMKDQHGFELGLYYYQAGTNETDGSATAKYTFSYVGIPILYKYALRSSEESEWHLKAGLTQSFLISKKYTVENSIKSNSTSSFKMNSLDTLLTIGTDYLFIAQNPDALNYWAQATFSFGLTNLGIANSTQHTELFNLSVGLFF